MFTGWFYYISLDSCKVWKHLVWKHLQTLIFTNVVHGLQCTEVS